MGTTEENKVRRHAKRLGLILHKSRAKMLHFNDLMGYAIIDPSNNGVCAGAKYDLSLEEVEEWLDDYEKQLRKGGQE